MRNYLIFNGIDSRDFHVYLANVEQFNGAEKTVERKKILVETGIWPTVTGPLRM